MIEVKSGPHTYTCATIPGHLNRGEIRHIPCVRRVFGNIVKIRLMMKEKWGLTLCEVEVYGKSNSTGWC